MNTRMRKIGVGAIVVFLIILYMIKIKSSNDDMKNQSVISLKSLLFGAIRAAEVGGLEVLAVHDQSKFNIEIKGKTKEGINDPVTAADYRSHCAMYHSLIQAFPTVTVISEEISKNCDKVNIPDLKTYLHKVKDYNIGDDVFVNVSDVTVWIDPLDATKEFTENLLQYVSTMVCVAVNGEPIIGVIYKPFNGEKSSNLFWSWVNHGISENLKNIPKAERAATPTLIVSRSHAGHVLKVSKNAFGEAVNIVSAAGAGYKFLAVAYGNATAYVHTTAIKKWDICAGMAILSTLGGTITSLYQQESIDFSSGSSKILTSGLLATMNDHNWYLKQFSRVQR